MSAFSGPQGKGAMRARHAEKKRQAEERNALTPPHRRRRAILHAAVTGLLQEIREIREAQS